MIYYVDTNVSNETDDTSRGTHQIETEIEQFNGSNWRVVGLERRRDDGVLERALFNDFSAIRPHNRRTIAASSAQITIEKMAQ